MSVNHGMIDLEKFRLVVESAPLVSVDLLVENEFGEFLFGKRLYKPAEGFWFVPGGRIRKDETIVEALSRVMIEETGVVSDSVEARFIGVFEHIYEDSIFSTTDDYVGTHYIALGYHINFIGELKLEQMYEQHSEICWLKHSEVISDESVHENSRAYIERLLQIK